MITFVCWKWDRPGHDRVFRAEYVHILRAMIARHYKGPHRFVCITDRMEGLNGIETLMMDSWPYADVPSPHGHRFPSCYRRLWNFSREAMQLGPRIFALDIDVVITGDLTPLVARQETFVGWTDARASWANKVAGGVYLLRTGAHEEVWRDFNPEVSPKLVMERGLSGSDQGWISYCMYPPPGRYTAADGVISSKWVRPGGPLPPGTRIVSTPGEYKPWHEVFRRRYPWVARYWKQ